jgi:hypothetical protein
MVLCCRQITDEGSFIKVSESLLIPKCCMHQGFYECLQATLWPRCLLLQFFAPFSISPTGGFGYLRDSLPSLTHRGKLKEPLDSDRHGSFIYKLSNPTTAA